LRVVLKIFPSWGGASIIIQRFFFFCQAAPPVDPFSKYFCSDFVTPLEPSQRGGHSTVLERSLPPDVLDLIPTLLNQFGAKPVGSLMNVSCNQFHYLDKVRVQLHLICLIN